MIPKYAPADLGLLSIAPQSGMVKHTKFDHVLDTIFCAFWTESVHGATGFKNALSVRQMMYYIWQNY